MSISIDIHNCAHRYFGIGAVKPYQLLVTHRIIEQFDQDEVENQLVILPTGSGKSICFLVPAILCKKITIIIYPLLALMNDQKEKLLKAGVDCVDIRGGQSVQERKALFNKLDNGTKIIITNPETLNQPKIIKLLQKYDIELLVIDEAHVISQWGKEFRPAYMQLQQTVQQLKPHQTIAFTATATEQTISDIYLCLFSKPPIVVQADADRDNIYYSAYPVYSKLQGVVEILKFCERPTIIFCGRRNLTYEIAMQLKRFFPDYPIRYYHAGLSKQERSKIEVWFKKTANAVLITTCAYGLGVDLPGIRTIIHYDLPEDALEYLQESGRAGRDRKPSSAWVLVPVKDKDSNSLINIFRENTCRRKALLQCLGETKEECAGCDVCTKNIIKQPFGHEEITTFVKRYSFKYSKNEIAGILSGSPFYHKYRMNPFFGILDMDGLLLEETINIMAFPYIEKSKRGNLLYYDNRLNRLLAKLIIWK